MTKITETHIRMIIKEEIKKTLNEMLLKEQFSQQEENVLLQARNLKTPNPKDQTIVQSFSNAIADFLKANNANTAKDAASKAFNIGSRIPRLSNETIKVYNQAKQIVQAKPFAKGINLPPYQTAQEEFGGPAHPYDVAAAGKEGAYTGYNR